MKAIKLSKKRLTKVQSLVQKASSIFYSIYGENFNVEDFRKVTQNIYLTAKKSNKHTWEYNCENLVINLTK